MIQITPQMRILVAIAPADFRCGIDGLGRVVRDALKENPLLGTLFIFRNRQRTAIKLLVYDGQGFWLCHKRLSVGRFRYWPTAEGAATALQAHEVAVLLSAGNPASTQAAPLWRPVNL